MDEKIDILSDDLSIMKTCMKSEAHKNGWFHASVHIWFYTKDFEVLFQKRSENKIAFPGLWDVSVAGHITSGETIINSAIREVEEEIGLIVTKADLIKIGDFKEMHKHNCSFIDNEIHHIYICELKCSIDELKIQEEELTALQLISINKFKEKRLKLGFNREFVSHYPKYYDFILYKIIEQLK